MTEQTEQMIFNEGYRRGKADRHKMLDDGTLVVSVDDATAVTRVLVEDSEKNGDLYYADRPKGEWEVVYKASISIPSNWNKIDNLEPIYRIKLRCPFCGFQKDFIDGHTAQYNFCPQCGADMRGDNNEAD